MRESVSNKYNKYKPFDLQQLKVDLTQIILFSSGTSKLRTCSKFQKIYGNSTETRNKKKWK